MTKQWLNKIFAHLKKPSWTQSDTCGWNEGRAWTTIWFPKNTDNDKPSVIKKHHTDMILSLLCSKCLDFNLPTEMKFWRVFQNYQHFSTVIAELVPGSIARMLCFLARYKVKSQTKRIQATAIRWTDDAQQQQHCSARWTKKYQGQINWLL